MHKGCQGGRRGTYVDFHVPSFPKVSGSKPRQVVLITQK